MEIEITLDDKGQPTEITFTARDHKEADVPIIRFSKIYVNGLPFGVGMSDLRTSILFYKL